MLVLMIINHCFKSGTIRTLLLKWVYIMPNKAVKYSTAFEYLSVTTRRVT